MRARTVLGVFLALAAPPALLVTTACKAPQQPGTSLGTFRVSGTLVDNTCGEGFQPESMLSFRAEVRRSGTSAYWRMGEGPTADGSFNAQGEFRFRYQSVLDGWPADPDNGIPACRFTQTETIIGRIEADWNDEDAGASDAAITDAGVTDAGGADGGPVTGGYMTATNTIDIGVAPGFDCSLALIAAGVGGPFPQLPCRASYGLEGVPAE